MTATATPQPDYAAVPEEFRARDQWVVWKAVERGGKTTKVPYRADGAGRASSTDPTAWAKFDAAVAAAEALACDGIGFVFSPGDPFVGVDLDADVPAADRGAIMSALNSYAEHSVSGSGIHIIVRASLNGHGRNRQGPFEVYDTGRYFVVTGKHIVGTPTTIEERQIELDRVLAQYLPKRQPTASAPRPVQSVSLDDRALIDKAMSARNGGDFTALYGGAWEGRFLSQSEADLALCSKLAFWAGRDPERIDRIFRTSGLMRDKWNRAKYRERTLEQAIADCTETYYPRARVTLPSTSGGSAKRSTDRPHSSSSSLSYSTTEWPNPPNETVYHGLVGEIVRAIEPHTESDPVALHVQILAAFGNVIGRGPYVGVEADHHAGNLFPALVGDTSRGRKGTSWGYVPRLFVFDPGFDDRVVSGLSSGEGLIYRVRDAITKTDDEEERIILDEGAADKRLLVFEPEFASVLKVIERRGSTTSPVIRNAWDGRPLSTLTRNSPLQATGAHISIVAHITTAELRRLLTATESANGFANRFLWLAVRRSKLLPEGGNLNPAVLDEYANRLERVVSRARRIGRVERDPTARALWREVYGHLSADTPGLHGALTARAEAQVTRLSLLYALLDEADAIGEPHLRAALALWDYSLRSTAYVFGDSTGNPNADMILRALRGEAPDGLTRTEISNLFGRNVSGARIDRALAVLQDAGLARVSKEATGGRPAERWTATTNETKQTNEDRVEPTRDDV